MAINNALYSNVDMSAGVVERPLNSTLIPQTLDDPYKVSVWFCKK